MIKLIMLFKKTVLVALVVALSLAALPVTSVYACGLNAPDVPPATDSRQTDGRLELVWVRLQRVYERQGHLLQRANMMVEKVQGIIDRLGENGKDVTALQAALDAFEGSLREAHSVYESATGIINAHAGFDAGGTVTDRDQALETVRELGEKLKEIRQLVGEPGKALREAIRAFRDAHRPTINASSAEG